MLPCKAEGVMIQPVLVEFLSINGKLCVLVQCYCLPTFFSFRPTFQQVFLVGPTI